MTAWSSRATGSGSSAGTGRQFTGGGSGAGSFNPVVTSFSGPPPASGGGLGEQPGVIQINPLDPAASIEKSGESAGQTFDGLRTALFGSSTPDGRNIRGGLGAGIFGDGGLGDIPLIGDALRGASMLPGVVGTAASAVWDTPGDILERMPVSGPLGEEAAMEELQRQFDSIPEDDPAKVFAREALAKDKGILDSGFATKRGHILSYAIREYDKAREDKANLFAGYNTMPGSVADTVGILFEAFTVVAPRIAQRAVAGADKPSSMDKNQLQALVAVAKGEAAFSGLVGGGTAPELRPAEALAVQKYNSKEWTEGEALDFLSSHGAGVSHNETVQIAGEVALDPLNLATFGAGAIAKAGVTGSRFLNTIRAAEKAIEGADKAVDAARVAAAATKAGSKAAAKAGEVVTRAEEVRDSYQAILATTRSYRGAFNAPGRVNILGRTAGRSEKATAALKAVGKFYESSVQATALGRGAKIIRTIIDPLHAMSLPGRGARGVDLTSDLLSKAAVDALSPTAHLQLLNHLGRLDTTGQLANDFNRDFAVAMANRGRAGVASLHQASQLLAGFGDTLKGPVDDLVIEAAMKAIKKGELVRWLKDDVARNTKIDLWDGDAHEVLARQLENLYHAQDKATWAKDIAKMSAEQKSFLKAAVYGRSNRALIDGITHSVGHASASGPLGPKLGRLILVAKGTLTRLGADGLIVKINTAKTTAAKAKAIRKAQERYPSLRYVYIDPHNEGRSVNEFMEYLDRNLERLPQQVTNDEIKGLHPELQDVAANLDGSYTLGFRPDDQYLWGLERSSMTEGGYRAFAEPFVDHVSDGGIGYRASRSLSVNIAGHPLLTQNVRNLVKPLDYMEAGARVMKSMVTGGMIASAAQKKFVARAVTKYGGRGMTEVAAQRMWERIQEFAGAHKGYSGPRGFSGDVLWNDLRERRLIPKTLNPITGFDETDVMKLVLEAYDGDIRFIGLTQKLTARAKSVLSFNGRVNFAGEVAEHAWPTLKFRLNPIFQMQEKVEGWILNAARGVHGQLTGPVLNDADKATQALLDKMVNQSIVSLGDVDQFEYSAAVQFGKLFESGATVPGSAMERIKRHAAQIGNVQGVKRVNMLRTFQNGLGKELKGIWENSKPGVWEDMRTLGSLKAGRDLSDDEYALQLMAEQMLANDVLTTGAKAIDYANSVKPGAWATPTDLGELKGLDLDHVAKATGIDGVNGKPVETVGDIRRAMAAAEDPGKVVEDVADGLRRFGADADYIARVENALNFSWDGFWRTAADRFSLTPAESAALQNYIGRAADMRGMTPVDYMSQVFSPGIIKGQEGLLGDLTKPLDLLRKSGDGRAQLAGVQGISTSDDLAHQLSAVFASHLDPSAKRALLIEFRPELKKAMLDGRVQFEPGDWAAMWDDEADTMLADRILGYMNGAPGEGAHDVVTDAARGVATVRDAARKYQTDRGVTPLDEDRYYAVDDDLHERTAKAYSAMAETPYDPGKRPTAKEVHSADSTLKPKPDDVDDRTYEAYQDFSDETADQFEYITAPKSKGGMGIKVTVTSKPNPYETSAAMRADVAAGRLKVYAGEAAHPLLTNPQTVRFRAVHDVFGHAGEGFEFGPRGELNAAAAHSRMYSDTARGALLTETHGQNAWVSYSDDIIPSTKHVPAATFDDAKAAYEAGHTNAPRYTNVSDLAFAEGKYIPKTYVIEDPVGPGFDAVVHEGPRSAEEARAIIDDQLRLRNRMTGAPVQPLAIDVVDLAEHPMLGGWGYDAIGLAIGSRAGTPVAFIDKSAIGNVARAESAERRVRDIGFRAIEQGRVLSNGNKKRSVLGAPFSASGDGAIGTARHELWHNIDTAVRYGPNSSSDEYLERYARYNDFVDRLTAADVEDITEEVNGVLRTTKVKPTRWTKAREQLSEYSFQSDEEAVAELGALISNPDLVITDLPTELRQAVEEFIDIIDEAGIFAREAVDAPGAGMSVRAANAAKPGTVFAKQKVGLLPQDILDDFGTKFVGRGKHVESNPDVARAAQMFGKWTTGVLKDGLLNGENATHARLLQDVAGMPTMDAVPYNMTEALLMQQATEAMTGKWRDAFRLQYFAQSRSMFERSINHPMFGIYPASYMFGKIGPEVVRFIAKNPFGLEHGGLARSMADVQAAITMQREFNPEFDAKIEELGHSQALSWLGFMLPTLPWEVSAAFPGWVRDLASQGLQQQEVAAAGGETDPTNLLSPAVAAVKKLSPLTTTLPWLNRAVDEAFFSEEPEATPAQTLAQEPVTGLGLGPTLQEQMSTLRNALTR